MPTASLPEPLPEPLSEAINAWLDSEPAESTGWEAGPLKLLSGILTSWLQVSTTVRVDGPNGPYEREVRPGPGGGLEVPMDVSYQVRHHSSPGHECPGHRMHLQASHWREYAGRWQVVDSLTDGGWQSTRWCLASDPPQTVGAVRANRVAVGQPAGQASVAYVRVHNDDSQALAVSVPTQCGATVGRRGVDENGPLAYAATIPAGGTVDLGGFAMMPVLRGTVRFFVGPAETPEHPQATVSVPVRGRLSHFGWRGWCACSVAAANLADGVPTAEPPPPTRVSRRWWGRRRGDGAAQPR